jgi:glucose-1-phosphate cytidylyltransferase
LKVAILAGGAGLRLSEQTVSRPKPLVEIGGRPIIWHLMRYYAHYGFRAFSLALGYKGDMIKRYFLEYRHLTGPFTVSLATGEVRPSGPSDVDWLVDLVDTGEGTETGGRLKRLAPWVADDTFMLTYCDGLANIDLRGLLDFHRHEGKLATVTAIREPSRFGLLNLNGSSMVKSFAEKPQTEHGWINGGFFVLEPGVMDYIDGDSIRWEAEPLERLAADGQLAVYKHEAFWQCMDTGKEVRLLNEIWDRGAAPWKV